MDNYSRKTTRCVIKNGELQDIFKCLGHLDFFTLKMELEKMEHIFCVKQNWFSQLDAKVLISNDANEESIKEGIGLLLYDGITHYQGDESEFERLKNLWHDGDWMAISQELKRSNSSKNYLVH